PQPRSPARAPRRPLAAAERDRGTPALRHTVTDVRAVGARTLRDPRRGDPARRGARPRVRGGHRRPLGLPPPRRARPAPRAEPAPLVRGRHPLLPRRPARPSGAPGLVRDADGPVPEPGARRGPPLG